MIELVAALGGVKTGLDLLKAARDMLKKEKIDVATLNAHLSDTLYFRPVRVWEMHKRKSVT